MRNCKREYPAFSFDYDNSDRCLETSVTFMNIYNIHRKINIENVYCQDNNLNTEKHLQTLLVK